ncbi:TIGR03986 family type III CRISPR-associated RAMP protein [Methylobacter psychrophilus]|uniref:TIGR03986 family type III CRISPR-associated RAMP protein n=1 Tax=Methylobacter psychrophilus TaxID=96941 RepID=UPI0021D4AF00|nr:TIGR03986 family CRISPR-associated RAMP protein [Methylobacter psychrophilus]
MSEWKKARIARIEKVQGQDFAYCDVDGESTELRKTVNELKRAGITAIKDVELEVTIKKEKGVSKIDRYKPFTISQVNIPKPIPNKLHTQLNPVGIPKKNPYTFLPIDLASTVKDTPVWHDGSSEEKTYSGELCCTLTALTPLLVGNQSFKVKDAKSDELPAPKDNLDLEKAIMEPLRLPDDRVVLPGSSLKGMLRNHLAALLDAPMDRVKEHHYTYRPNLDFNKQDVKEKYAARPAIVTDINGDQIKVKVLPNAQSAIFCRNDVERLLTPGTSIRQINNADWKIDRNNNVDKSHIVGKNKVILDLEQDHTIFKYSGGIDGEGKFALAFNSSGTTHYMALVSETNICDATQLTIPIPIYHAYQKTQKVLADDKEGHLASPLHKHFNGNVAKAIEASTALQINQLIYVEVELNNGQPEKIVSMGHHFRYRWAYRDSIRYVNAIDPSQRALRPELDAAAKEQEGKLTGAHLLFGFVGDSKEYNKGKRLLDGNKEAIDKLAGRIAINHAIEVIPEDKPRFLNEDNKNWVFLKILGQPKASAVEHYLKQPKIGLMKTYGDLTDQPVGELAGRKWYRHQPKAASDASCYEESDDVIRNGNLSTLARYVSAPDSTFRFTLRFARLRDWELGALIVALNPHRLKDNLKTDDYALKLGYGRPLGLGSVSITIDAVQLEGQPVIDPEADLALWLKAARSKLSGNTIKTWLEVLRYQGEKLAYPTAPDNKKELTIFNYHTDIRKQYSKDRRKA